MTTQDGHDGGDDRRDLVIEQPGGVLSNAPWWLVSAGLHAVLILGATLVAIERMVEVEAETAVVIVTQPPSGPWWRASQRRAAMTALSVPTPPPPSATRFSRPP